MKKKCSSCNQIKALKQFGKDKNRKDKHNVYCRKCIRNKSRENYSKNWKSVQSNRKRWLEKEENRKKYNALTLKSYYKNKKKCLARFRTRYLVSIGVIRKRSCEVCAGIETEAHHKDYGNPLEVVWLCVKHHRKHHGRLVNKQL